MKDYTRLTWEANLEELLATSCGGRRLPPQARVVLQHPYVIHDDGEGSRRGFWSLKRQIHRYGPGFLRVRAGGALTLGPCLGLQAPSSQSCLGL